MPYLSVIAPFGFAEFNPPTLLRLYRQLGCRGCEYYRNMDNMPNGDEARRVAEDAGLPFDSIHGLFGPAYDPSCLDESVRLKMVELYKWEGELAAHLGALRVVVHPAPPAKDPQAVTEAVRAERVTPLRKTMDDLAAIGESLGVTYLFENIPRNYYFASDAKLLAQLVRELNHPNVRMCFDTGHAHMAGDAPQALRDSIDVVAYFHIHDNDGVRDSHQVPGKGSFPWDEFQTVISGAPPETPAMLELFKSEPDLTKEINNSLGTKLSAWLGLKST